MNNVEEDFDDLSLDNTKQAANSSFDGEKRLNVGMWKFYAKEISSPYYFTWLCSLKNGLPAHLHYTNKGTVICLKSKIFTGMNPDDEGNTAECPTCKEPDSFNKDKLNKPANVLIMPGYCHNSVGQKISYKKKDGSEVVTDDQPVKGVEIKRGANDVNLSQMLDSEDEGELAFGGIWEVMRYPKELKKSMSVLVPASLTKVKKALIQSVGTADVAPAVLEKYQDKTRQEMRGILLSLYSNERTKIDWENPILKKYVVKPEEDAVEQTAAEAGVGSLG